MTIRSPEEQNSPGYARFVNGLLDQIGDHNDGQTKSSFGHDSDNVPSDTEYPEDDALNDITFDNMQVNFGYNDMVEETLAMSNRAPIQKIETEKTNCCEPQGQSQWNGQLAHQSNCHQKAKILETDRCPTKIHEELDQTQLDIIKTKLASNRIQHMSDKFSNGNHSSKSLSESEHDLDHLIGIRIVVPIGHCSNVDHRNEFIQNLFQKVQLLDHPWQRKVVLGKLPDDVFLFNLTVEEATIIRYYIHKSYPPLPKPQNSTEKHEERVTQLDASCLLSLKYRSFVTDEILQAIATHCQGTDKMEISYVELRNKMQFPLTIDLPIDYNRLIEVNRAGFYGLLVKREKVAPPNELVIKQNYIMVTVSLRRLAPIVHGFLNAVQNSYNGRKSKLTVPPVGDRKHVAIYLNDKFLKDILSLIDKTYPLRENRCAAMRSISAKVTGEGQAKPLEHLVACIPGIEVVWLAEGKCIRKLELSKLEEDTEKKSTFEREKHQTDNNTAQEITKTLTAILKDPKNQYMRFADLKKEYLAKKDPKLEIPSSTFLKEFVKKHVKHFQIIGREGNELVMLSHRAQIKRISNDVSRLLRARNPKCINAAELPGELVELWLHSRDSEELDVSRFGVCYLDDLLVTLPQHWGIYCSEYISNETGALVVRQYGDGMEDVPNFIKLEYPTGPIGLRDNLSDFLASEKYNDFKGYSIVHAWIPISHRSDYKLKLIALLRQQILNMCRGDPTAADLKSRVENLAIHYSNHQQKQQHNQQYRRQQNFQHQNQLTPQTSLLKRYENACLRCNRQAVDSVKQILFSASPAKPATTGKAIHSNKSCSDRKTDGKHHMPCNFELDFKEFIPTFHHVFNCQAIVSDYGTLNLFELFDLMGDTVLLTHFDAADAKIKLTAEARRDVLERRLIHILRRSQYHQLSFKDLTEQYKNDPTMSPFYDECEIWHAVCHSNLIVIKTIDGKCFTKLKPRFSLKEAMRNCADVANLLSIFMTSFTPLTFDQLQRKFQSKFGCHMPLFAFMVLEEMGAIRKTRVHNVSAAKTAFDLQDICRTVRNLIYQMTDKPYEKYYVPDESTDTIHVKPLERQELSIHKLLEHSGDCMCPEFDVKQLMNDFDEFFHEHNQTEYTLKPHIIAGVPTREDMENKKKNQKKCHSAHASQTTPRGRADTK